MSEAASNNVHPKFNGEFQANAVDDWFSDEFTARNQLLVDALRESVQAVLSNKPEEAIAMLAVARAHAKTWERRARRARRGRRDE